MISKLRALLRERVLRGSAATDGVIVPDVAVAYGVAALIGLTIVYAILSDSLKGSVGHVTDEVSGWFGQSHVPVPRDYPRDSNPDVLSVDVLAEFQLTVRSKTERDNGRFLVTADVHKLVYEDHRLADSERVGNLTLSWPEQIRNEGSGTVSVQLSLHGTEMVAVAGTGAGLRASAEHRVVDMRGSTELEARLVSAAFEIEAAQNDGFVPSNTVGWIWSVRPREGVTGKNEIVLVLRGQPEGYESTILATETMTIDVGDNDWAFGPAWADDVPIELWQIVVAPALLGLGFFFREIRSFALRQLRKTKPTSIGD
jgi:hypothetical protein